MKTILATVLIQGLACGALWAGAAAPAASVAAPGRSIIGWWFFDFAPAGLSFLLKISPDGKGGYQATQDNLVIVGKRDQPDVPFWCDGRNVRTEINHGSEGIVQLRLNDKGDELAGMYRNGDLTIPTTYKRVQPSDFPPEPPLNYSSASGGRKDLRGYWAGSVTRGEGKFGYAFNIGQAPDGTFRGSFDSYPTGRLNNRLTHATLSSNQVKIGNRDLDVRFEGTLSPDGDTMNGKIVDGPDSDEIVFARLAAPAQPPALRAEADPGELGGAASAWDGFVDRQRSDTRTRMRIGHDGGGSVLALINNPEEKDPILVASTSATVQRKVVRLVWKGRGVEFQGELRGDQLEGTWIEGKSKTPIVFRRVQPAE